MYPSLGILREMFTTIGEKRTMRPFANSQFPPIGTMKRAVRSYTWIMWVRTRLYVRVSVHSFVYIPV